MRDPIEQRAYEAFGAEGFSPFLEAQITGDQGRGPLIPLRDQFEQRWSRNFGPVVKVDRMKKVTIQNEETKEPFARIQSQGCA